VIVCAQSHFPIEMRVKNPLQARNLFLYCALSASEREQGFTA